MKHTALLSSSTLFALLFSSAAALATDPPAPTPETGSSSVLVEGLPAKRAGDIPGAVTAPDVFIDGQPVVTGCTEGVPILSKSVFINGKPKVLGCQK